MSEQQPKAGFFGFGELRRRHVLRTLALYIVGSWVLMQVADVVFPALDIPEQAIRYLLYAAVVGLPVALVFGWFFDITAGGIQRTGCADAGEADDALPLRLPDYLLLAALGMVLAAIIYGTVNTVVDLPSSTVADSSSERAPRGDGPPMVAVLPFTYRGAGDDAAFFAGGVHDDLLTQLSQLSGLRVVSRTSVLSYENTTKAIPVIGRELGADAILEGGVQLAGGHIRINAQLIDARGDEHLWAETFDRELTPVNLFAVQSEIAEAIAVAMQATLNTTDNASLKLIPTDSMAAYRAFHEGVTLRDNDDRLAAIQAFERAVDLDPRFTRAMAELAGMLSLVNSRAANESEIARAETLIATIGEIAPDSVEHLQALSLYTYYVVQDYELADQLISAARQSEPSNVRLLSIQYRIARRGGDYERAVELVREARRLEPTKPYWDNVLVYRLMVVRRYHEAGQLALSLAEKSAATQRMLIQMALAEHGDTARYRDELLRLYERSPGEGEEELLEAHFILRDFDAAAALISTMPDSTEIAIRYNFIPWDLYLMMRLHLASGNRSAFAETASAAREILELDPALTSSRFEAMHPKQKFVLALALGEESKINDALADLRELFRRDGAESMKQDFYCEALALLKRAEGSARCLRRVMREPGTALPFLDPLLPYYDAVRDSPEFQQMMAEFAEEDWPEPLAQ